MAGWRAAALIAIGVAATASAAPTTPAVAQGGDAGESRDRAVAAYATGNAALRGQDLRRARRDLESAIAAEQRYFAALGSERRQGEASYYIEYLTLGGVAEYRTNGRDAAIGHWTAARALYREYLPRLNGRLAVGDGLVAHRRCREAFSAYSPAFAAQDSDVVAALRSGANGRWSDAQRETARTRGTTAGDLLRGIVLVCAGDSRTAAESAFVEALADYAPTTSETPNTGPLQASAVRLVLFVSPRGSAASRK